MKNSTKALLAALLAAGSAALTWSFVFILDPRTTGTPLPVKWDAGPVPIRIMLGDTQTLQDNLNFNTSAQAAAQAWNAVLGSVQFQVTLAPAPATPPSQNNSSNDLFFSDTIFGEGFEGNTIAVTLSFRAGNSRTRSDIVFNAGRLWNSYRGVRQSSATVGLDIQRVAMHELGHVLGLAHPNEAGQTITPLPIMHSTVNDTDALTDDDIAGGQSLYGPPGIPPNDSFANAILITLGNSSTIAVNGHNTNATREAGEPSHANNSGPSGTPNPGGRSVWWRWVAPSTGGATLDTRGSHFDTLLAVYTGSSVAALTPIAANDDITPGIVQASTVTITATAGTTYRIAVDGFNNEDGAGADSGGITLNLAFSGTLGTAPGISAQPASVTVNTGGAATFFVTATGTEPFAYQWFFNNTAISGATAPTHAVNNAQTANAGSYHVTVTNAAGSITSNTATLTVNTPPPPPPPSGGGGGGGGGGAPSLGFAGALLALVLVRRFFCPSRA